MAKEKRNLFFKLTALAIFVLALRSTGYVFAYTGPGALTAGSGAGALSVSGSNIGIGSASPILPLQVKDNATAYPYQAAQFTTTDWTTTVGSTFQIGHGASTGNTFSELRALTSGYNAWGNLIMQVGGGRVGIGTSTPAYTLDVNGNVRATAFVGALSGSMAADNVSSGSFGSLQGGGVYTFPASVGIGTTTVPSERLEVTGKLKITNSFSTTNAALVYKNDTDYLFLGPQSGSSVNGAYFSLAGSTNGDASAGSGGIAFGVTGVAPAMVIKATTGNVGIGTTAPSGNLHVNSTGNTFVNFDAPAGNLANLQFLSGGIAKWGLYRPANSIDLRLDSNAVANIMSWTNAGNVGVGTTTPAQKLSVVGTIESTTGGFKFPDGTIQTTAGGGGGGQWTTSSTSIYYNGGNVGIGTSAPSQKLEVSGSVKATAFIGTLSGSVAADNVSSGSFGSLQGGGTYSFPASVGIGTTAPLAKLHVNATTNQNLWVTANTNSVDTSSIGIASVNDANTAYQPLSFIASRFNFISGSVGIKTTAPGAPLNIAPGSAQFPTALFIDQSTHATSKRASIDIGTNAGSGTTGWEIGQDSNGTGTKDFYIYDINSSAHRLNIGTTGNVGIGTTAAIGKLQVNNNSASANEFLTLQNAQGWSLAGLNGALQSIKWRDGSNVVAGIGAAYNLGGTGTDVSLAFHSLYNTGYQTDANIAMVIRGTGNVGIGTTAPAQKLDVNGTVALYGKVAFEGQDTWLRINQSSTFTSGTYFGSNIIRTDGQLQVGWNGSAFLATSAGNVTASGYVADLTGRLARNLLDTNTWTVSSGSIGGWISNESVAGESQRAWDLDPFGNTALIWEGVTNAGNDASGGWNYYNIPITNTKAYRSTVWFKPNAGAVGNLYLGLDTGNTNNLNGTANTNPYFHAIPAANFVAGRWYLFVGYIHASNDPSTLSYSAVYDGVTGQKVFTGTDYKNTPTATVQTQRAYSYYNTATGTTVYFWGPRFEQMDGSEPSIGALLGGTGSSANPMYVNGGCTGAVTIDWSHGATQHCTLTGPVTFTFTNGTSGGNYRLVLLQDATGGRTATWPASVRWGSMGVPSLTATPSKTDYVGFLYNGVSSAYDGIAFNSNF